MPLPPASSSEPWADFYRKGETMIDDDQGYQQPEQSVMLTGCPLCRVLYPEREGRCKDCGGGFRQVEAQMMSRELIQDRVEMVAQAYLRTPGNSSSRRKALNALLQTLFVYSRSALTFLEGAGVDLDRLRQDHETLPEG